MQNTDEIFSVSELNASAREVLEESFSSIQVEGEISNCVHHSSGHIYFSLKDDAAQIRCAFFRGRNRFITFKPKDGMHVVVRAQVSLYEGRGDYQLIIETVEETGDGALRRAFEKLKLKLAELGLFEPQFKKALPPLPHCIGIITSPTGAAVQDILTVLKRRFPAIPVIIYPVVVQGAEAATTMIKAIQIANERAECDVILLARGGGSLEDLWAFNDEHLAQAIFKSVIPIVAGIGHEVDFTIADFVADVRAPTPSAAAELVSPNQTEWLAAINQIYKRLLQLIQQLLKHHHQELRVASKSLRHPGHILREQMQRMDHVEQRLTQGLRLYFHKLTTTFNEASLHLQRLNPEIKVKKLQDTHQQLERRLQNAMQHRLTDLQKNVINLARTLDAVSPLATLDRGYAIVKTKTTQQIIRSVEAITPGDEIIARVAKGSLECVVKKIMSE